MSTGRPDVATMNMIASPGEYLVVPDVATMNMIASPGEYW